MGEGALNSSGMDISIITSLYASADHLGRFLKRLEGCVRSVESRGNSVESILVSNAPSKRERRILDTALESPWWSGHGRLIVVERETIYASWNRALRASVGTAIAFWNVDDDRNPAALVEGANLIREGHAVVEFPWVSITEPRTRFRSATKRHVYFHDREGPAGPDPDLRSLGPFFMFDRRLVGEYGLFDERFHIAGDWDWQLRVVPHVELTVGESLAGVFFADGTNLSGSGSPRLHVEQNVIVERYAVEHPLWPLDDHARALLAHYGASEAVQAAATYDWTYDRRWLRLRPLRRMYYRCRHIVGTPIRLMRERKGNPG